MNNGHIDAILYKKDTPASKGITDAEETSRISAFAFGLENPRVMITRDNGHTRVLSEGEQSQFHQEGIVPLPRALVSAVEELCTAQRKTDRAMAEAILSLEWVLTTH